MYTKYVYIFENSHNKKVIFMGFYGNFYGSFNGNLWELSNIYTHIFENICIYLNIYIFI